MDCNLVEEHPRRKSQNFYFIGVQLSIATSYWAFTSRPSFLNFEITKNLKFILKSPFKIKMNFYKNTLH